MQDGALSDTELNSFQVNCFSAPLQPEELIGVRRVVSESMPQVRPRAIRKQISAHILGFCLGLQLCSTATVSS